MDETIFPSDSNANELSADDLAIIQAFDAMENLEVEETGSATPVSESPRATQPLVTPSPASLQVPPDDMLGIFVEEAEEAFATMRHALEQLEQDDRSDAPAFSLLQRTAHKLKGTAGSIGYEALSTLAQHVQALVKLVQGGRLIYVTGLIALIQTVQALEMTLQNILTDGQESKTALMELEEGFKELNIDIRTGDHKGPPSAFQPPSTLQAAGDYKANKVSSLPSQSPSPLQVAGVQSPTPSVRVEVHRLEQLVQCSEQLVEQRTAIESAQKQVEEALEELYAAQVRLHSLEAVFTSLPFAAKSSKEQLGRPVGGDELMGSPDSLPISSLVARILNEAAQRSATTIKGTTNGTSNAHLLRKSLAFSHLSSLQNVQEAMLWDELEIDRYTEDNLLAHSLGEAIADVTTASSQLRTALAQLNSLVEHYMTQASVVRSRIHLLRSAPLAILLPRLKRAIQMGANAQRKQVLFEVKGETTEVDQDILEALANPLLQLVRNCDVASFDSSSVANSPGHEEHPCRMWLHADTVGSEVIMEIGFSMTVEGGVLDALREPISRLNGSIAAQRNAEGGISFLLRLPRSKGAVQGLLVRAGNARVVVPFSQVQRIDYDQEKQYELLYTLSDLLNFPAEQFEPETMRPVLIAQFNSAVQIDEILGNVELVMKPLATHLQRPGIAGAAIDGMGNVLLILDIPELVRRRKMLASGAPGKHQQTQNARRQPSQQVEQAFAKILVADDSVYIRRSLHQTLSHAGYSVMEARDGMQTLEQLLEHSPHLLLLDIEMPNLNGYDLLSIIRAHPLLAKLKIVVLSSRMSQKHQRRALEMGAHAYLAKPCPQDMLLQTISSVLAQE